MLSGRQLSDPTLSNTLLFLAMAGALGRTSNLNVVCCQEGFDGLNGTGHPKIKQLQQALQLK